MALLFFEGFNRTVNTSVWTLTGTGTDQIVAFNSTDTTFRGDAALKLPSGAAQTATCTLPSAQSGSKSVFVGFCLKNNPFSTNNYPYKYFSVLNSSGAEECSIWMGYSDYTANQSTYTTTVYNKYKIYVVQDNSLVATFYIPTTVGPFPTGTNGYDTNNYGAAYLNNGNYYFEFKFDLAANTIAIRVNGTQLLSSASATTAPLTITQFKSWRFVPHTSIPTLYVDDFYVLDSTGTTNNTWLGYKTRVLSPNATALKYPATPTWTLLGNTAATPQGCININDGDQNIITANTSEARMTFDFPTSTTNTIAGVRLQSVARNEGLPCAMRLVMADNQSPTNVTNLSDELSLDTAYYKTYDTGSIATNPVTGQPWTLAELNSLAFGVQYVS